MLRAVDRAIVGRHVSETGLNSPREADPTVRNDFDAAAAGFARAAALAQREVGRALFAGRQTATAEPELIAGRYQLGERLGAGAQGSVWRAFDGRLRRDVAVKTSHVDRSADVGQAQAWLRHEAKMLGRVPHPNVVAVFDIGIESGAKFGAESEGLVMFAVLEFVRGRTLSAWLAERVRTTAEINSLFRDVAAGLQAAHDAGLVHCDVKPSNIMVGAAGVAKLGDFGLAHAQRLMRARGDAHTTESHSQTDVGAAASTTAGPFGGTPNYMPPEQFTQQRVDARADQYALAATWFEALFGSAPHRGSNVLQLEEAKQRGAPRRPSDALSESAYAALVRGLSPDPADRYSSVAEFASAVAIGHRGRRAALVLGAAAGIVLVGLAATASSPRPGCSAEDLSDRVPKEIVSDVARGASMYEQQIAQRIATLWGAQSQARLEVRREVCQAKLPDPTAIACLDAVDRLTEQSVEPFEIRGHRQLEHALSVILALPDPRSCLDALPSEQAERLGAATEEEMIGVRQALSRASDLGTDVRPEDVIAMLDTIDRTSMSASVFANEIDLQRASALDELGRFEEAERIYGDVWNRSASGNSSLDATRAANGLARVVGYSQGRVEEGHSWIRHARSQLARFGDAPAYEAELLSVSATIYSYEGKHATAVVEVDRAVELGRANDLSEEMTMSWVQNAATMRMLAGDLDAAEINLREVLAWLEAEQGPTHPDVAQVLTTLAFLERKRDNDVAAASLLDRALQIYEVQPNRLELQIAKVETSRAALALDRRQFAAALESLGRADEIRIRLLPPEHPDLAAGVLMRLGALLDAGEIAKADALAQRSRDQLSAILRSESEAALQLEHTLSRIDALAGRPARALERLTAAIEVAQQRGKDSDMLARWCQQAGSLAGVVGDLDGATAWLDRAQRHFDAGKRPSDLGRGIDMLREVTTKALAARAADRSRGR